jgi:hypothetical protein
MIRGMGKIVSFLVLENEKSNFLTILSFLFSVKSAKEISLFRSLPYFIWFAKRSHWKLGRSHL